MKWRKRGPGDADLLTGRPSRRHCTLKDDMNVPSHGDVTLRIAQ